MRALAHIRSRGASRSCLSNQDGAIMIIVMMLLLVLLALGGAIIALTNSSRMGTQTERRGVKAFSVAEAGIDVGMVSLRDAWPAEEGDLLDVDPSDLRAEFPSTVFPDPSRSATPFLQVTSYDNSEGSPSYDASGPNGVPDGRMYVESIANVDDYRYRIRALVERHFWEIKFPPGIAVFSDTVDAVGATKMRVDSENPRPVPPGSPVFAYSSNPVKTKPMNDVTASSPPEGTTFDTFISDQLLKSLRGIAASGITATGAVQGTYFENPSAAETFLFSSQARGKIVYVKSNSAVSFAGNTQIGSRDQPVVLVLDTPVTAENALDFRGTADFYGVLIVRGHVDMRGTSSFYGSVYVSGTIDSHGYGASPEVIYNQQLISNINRQHVFSVNIVPNTWEEYTIPPDQL